MPSQASTPIADPMDISLPSQLPKGHPNFESRRDRIPSTNGRESLNESPEVTVRGTNQASMLTMPVKSNVILSK